VLRARSKKISLVLVLAMLMTMFAGLGTASAATGYDRSDVPLVYTDANYAGVSQRLGSIIVNFDNLPACKSNIGANKDHQFIVKLPEDFLITKFDISNPPIKGTGVVQPLGYTAGTSNQVLVEVYAASLQPEFKFAIDLEAKVPSNAPETIEALIIGESNSVFTDGKVQVAKTSGSSVTALAGDPVTITGGGLEKGKITIYFRENKKGALLKGNKSITLKLPQGFEWPDVKSPDVSFKTLTGGNEFTLKNSDSRTLEFNRLTDNLAGSIWKLEVSQLMVDESVAKFGDIEVAIGGSSNIAPSSVIIGKYADYGVEVKVADPEKKVIAGRKAQYVSDIKIEELIGDSLLPGRTIYMELPEGFRWVNSGEWNTPAKGGVDYEPGFPKIDNNNPELLKIVMKKPDNNTNKGSLEINRAQIDVAANIPDGTDVKVKFWGNAGIDEEVIIGKVVAPISAEADVEEVKIGLQKQVAGNIVITETEAEAIASSIYDDKDGTSRTSLTVTLPFNVYWGNIPTVEVIEGDIELGTITAKDQVLTIPIKTSSSVASKIEISDITYTVDRTVPEGDMVAEFGGNAVVQALFTNRNYVTEEVVAECVTPAPGETIGSGEFRIGSNIYYEGGVAKVMDVAPYIKNDRTYVPMRYLGEILGAEVVWDDAARTVTLTKGDTTVVFTIGSTSYTVNGEAKTADVAPEITNSRTMLPARFVAEAFGAVVGWDAATQTVLIQK
jgi:hypothetical protein